MRLTPVPYLRALSKIDFVPATAGSIISLGSTAFKWIGVAVFYRIDSFDSLIECTFLTANGESLKSCLTKL